MKIYITFGQDHLHENFVTNTYFDKDCIAAIECNSEKEGREKAFELFSDKWSFQYGEEIKKDLHYFPRGIIYI